MPDNQECSDCFRWNKNREWAGVLTKNISIYQYNEEMKAVLARYKFRGDAELSKLFAGEMNKTYREHFREAEAAVPIPLSEERLYERGFNQAELLAKQIPIPMLHPLKRISTEKQSKKSRKERLQNLHLFQLSYADDIQNKHLLLIDDLYTTGFTVRQAAKILLENGASSVSSLTLIRG
ncbi:ComF family protein [Metabacillus sp. GX 13764]|uniref:ComF family protein n=1 Tax=Metabacillus kandeliae TaxID=2900151 RepID=UPI001E4529CA|nr:ComF family protein [Metabacillus kandeliae]MCD7034453.1 ComF family protein [Metabacillus kandeliae]